MEHLSGHPQCCVAPREQEQKWAADHSRITRILGWCMIGAFVLQVASAIWTDHMNIDILLLIGGCSVLKGSQAWIRFYLFIGIVACVSLTWQIVHAYIQGVPLVASRKWVDHWDIEFWSQYAIPAGIYLGFALLCYLTLKSRQLVFWTKISKRWVGLLACLAGIIAVIAITKSITSRNQREKSRNAMALIRDHARAHGSTYTEPTMSRLRQALEQDASILIVKLSHQPNASMILYELHEKANCENGWDHEEFVKGPGGEWLKISIEFTQP